MVKLDDFGGHCEKHPVQQGGFPMISVVMWQAGTPSSIHPDTSSWVDLLCPAEVGLDHALAKTAGVRLGGWADGWFLGRWQMAICQAVNQPTSGGY